MKVPFFSFIIPVYNIEKYIEECVDSILSQNFKDFEIILVNDGSTDNSLGICQEFLEKDKRVILINKKNEGLAETRNKGLNVAKGKYVVFVDGDDYISKNQSSLKEVYNCIVEKKVDVLIFNLTCFEIRDNFELNIYPIPRIKNISQTTDLEDIFRRRIYLATACNKIVSRDLIEKNSLRFPKGLLSEDVKWCGDLLKHLESICFHSIDLYYYRQKRLGSITYRTSKLNLLDIAFQLKEHSYFIQNKSNKYVNEYYAFYYLSCLKQMCEHDEFTLKEIFEEMYSMKYFLKFSNEKRVLIFRLIVKIIGFKKAVKLMKSIVR